MSDRRLKPEFLYPRCGVTLGEATILDIRDQGLITLAGLEQCPKLVSLFASKNKLRTLAGLEMCPQLWRLDLSHNPLDSVHPLPLLPCMGHLNLSHTAVTLPQLASLRAMFIAELITNDCPELRLPHLSLGHNRLVLVHLLPRVWVLNGMYVTLHERAAAAEFMRTADPQTISATRGMLTSSRTRRPFNLAESVGAMQKEFLDAVSAHPDRPERIEPYQLRHLALFHAMDAPAVCRYGATFGTRTRSAPRVYLPSLHAGDVITKLSQGQLTDLASLLTAASEYNVPREILEDALTVLQLPLSSVVVQDLCSLPHFLMTVLVHFLYELVTDCESVTSREILSAVGAMEGTRAPSFDADKGFYSMDYFQQQIWASLPRAGILQAPDADLLAGVLEHSQQRFTVFPPVVPRTLGHGVMEESTMSDAVVMVPGIASIVTHEGDGWDNDPEAEARRATVADTMASVDAMIARETTEPSVASLDTANATRARHAAVLLSRSPRFPPMLTKPGEKLPRKELISNYVRLHPLLFAAGLSDVTGQKAPEAGTGGLTRPPSRQSLQLVDGEEYSSGYGTVGSSSGAMSREEGLSRPPVSPVTRTHIAGESGEATRVSAPIRLHRVTQALRRSGVPSAAGVVNIPIPPEFVRELRAVRTYKPIVHTNKAGQMATVLPMAPLRAWVLNGTWDPNFVLASSDMIEAENRAAVLLGALPSTDARNGGWADLSCVPFSRLAPHPASLREDIVPDFPVDDTAAGYEVDAVFAAKEQPLAPTKPDRATVLRLHQAPTLKPLAEREKEEAPLALTDTPVMMLGGGTASSAPAVDSANTDTFLTGVDIEEGGVPVKEEKSSAAPIVAVLPSLPTLPSPHSVRQTPSFTTSLQEQPKLVVTSRSYQSAAAKKAPVENIGKTGDKTWFAMPGRQQFIVSTDPVPWRGVRTRPVLPPTDDAVRPLATPPIAAAFVPSSRKTETPGPESKRKLSAMSSARASVASRASVSSATSGEFGLIVQRAPAPVAPPAPVSAPPAARVPSPPYTPSSGGHGPWQGVAGEDMSQPQVDEDGVYTIPVPGAGRVYASTHGPSPDISLLSEFATLMKRRPFPTSEPGRLSALAASGQRAMQLQ